MTRVVNLLIALASMIGFLLAVSLSAAAADKQRYALVIGNGDYAHAAKLPNPTNDANGMADALLALQFHVYKGIDLDAAHFRQIVAEFKAASADAGTVVFYYAGHGFQLNGSNYLVPVDALLQDRGAIDSETFVLNEIIAQIHNASRQTIVLLDACRNNPLPPGAADDEVSQGLAQLQTGNGTFIAFATQPGNVSKDGLGANSPFTGALLKHIATPRIAISDLLIAVRNAVEQETGGAQVPWDQSSLRAQFTFNPTAEAPGAAAPSDWTVASADTPADPGRSVGNAISVGTPRITAAWTVASIDEAVPLPAARIVEDTSLDPEKRLTRDIQGHLKRLNCSADAVDGDFGPKTAEAIRRVAKKIGVDLRSDAPDDQTLQELATLPGPLCTPQCGKNQKLKKGVCVAVASVGTGTAGGKAAGSKPQQKPAAQKPATSIGGGIGVGSFF
jgi:uncharacterized caspase-like protein